MTYSTECVPGSLSARLLPSLILTWALAACGGSTGPAQEEDPFADAPFDVVACSEMQPASASSLPLEHVALGRLPASLVQPIVARVETDDPAVFGWALVTTDGARNASLVAPIHPSGTASGGASTLWVTDGTRSCPPIDFTVQSLPSSPGELAEIVQLLQALVDAQAAALETTRQELIDTPLHQQPLALIPIAVLQGALDHPDNARSFAALVAGTAPNSSEARLDLLEPLIARTGLREALAGAIGPVPTPAHVTSLGGPQSVSAQSCTGATVGSNAVSLDACMDAAAEALLEVAGASSAVFEGMAAFFTGMSLVPALSVPASIAGFITWMALNDDLRTAALLPSRLTGMTAQVGPVDFMEDDDAVGSWFRAEVTATNLGWDFGKEFLEGLFAAASAIGVFQQLGLSGPVDNVLANLAAGPGVQALLGNGTIESFQIPPETYGPVDVSDPAWSEATITLGDAVELVSHTDFEPRNPGVATLSIRTKTGEFAGSQEAVNTQIAVGTLQVSISPDDVFVGEGRPWEFTVRVVGSAHPESVEIDLTASPLQGTADISYNGDSTHTVNYNAPGAPDVSIPDLLTVRHTAQSGARAYSSVEKLDIATIRFGGVVIGTNPTCLDPGQSLLLQASVLGPDDAELVWSATAGTITQSGQFTAPAQPQVVTVTVAYADNPDIKDSISVQVGCVCHFTVQVSSDPVYVAQPGDTAEYHSYGNPPDVLAIYLRGQSGRAWFAVDYSGPPPTGPGTYELSGIGGQLGYGGGPYATYGNDGGTIDISEFEAHTTLVGSVAGTMRDSADPTNIFLTIAATFSIYPPPQPAYGVYRCVVPAAGG